MKHVHCWSVFEDFSEFPGTGTIGERLSAERLDGFELFTLVEPVPQVYRVPEVVSVHLPYAIDWRCAWEGRLYEGLPDDLTYFSFGHDRAEQIDTVHRMIDYASVVNPAYGVLHAANTDMRQVLKRRHDSDDLAVLSEFCELVNSAVSTFPGGEPPFRIAFENLWWEGLRLRSPEEWRLMERKLEFDNWGFVLDTGHLMNSCDDAYDERSATDAVLDIVSRYPKDLLDRVTTMHLQLSTTAAFREKITDEVRGEDEEWDHFANRAYERAGAVDQHRPFETSAAREIVDAVKPDFVNHELLGGISKDRYGDLRRQRALFD